MKNVDSILFRICLGSCIITAVIIIYIALNILLSAWH